jgi:hypothetical protein
MDAKKSPPNRFGRLLFVSIIQPAKLGVAIFIAEDF